MLQINSQDWIIKFYFEIFYKIFNKIYDVTNDNHIVIIQKQILITKQMDNMLKKNLHRYLQYTYSYKEGNYLITNWYFLVSINYL